MIFRIQAVRLGAHRRERAAALRRAVPRLGHVLDRRPLLGRKRHHRRDQRAEDDHVQPGSGLPSTGPSSSRATARSRELADSNTSSRRMRAHVQLSNHGIKALLRAVLHRSLRPVLLRPRRVRVRVLRSRSMADFGPFGPLGNFDAVFSQSSICGGASSHSRRATFGRSS